MRIISGEKRGMRIDPPPKGEPARPTEDKIKEAVFNVLQPFRKQTVCMDVFAGTGQIGIEFLSRGARFCVFSEKSRGMARVLRNNIKKTKCEERSLVLQGDFRTNIARTPYRLDYVYLDPPFGSGLDLLAMKQLLHLHKLQPEALIIVESDRSDNTLDGISGYRQVFCRDYGTKRIRMYREELV